MKPIESSQVLTGKRKIGPGVINPDNLLGLPEKVRNNPAVTASQVQGPAGWRNLVQEKFNFSPKISFYARRGDIIAFL
jgi:hypothetical protein